MTTTTTAKTAAFTTTYDTGGVAKPSDEVTVNPERSVTTEQLLGFAGGQLNAPYLADFVSAVLMHCQCGRHLYRSVAGRTQNPMLARRYGQLADSAEDATARLQDLIPALGGLPGYVSPAARGTEKLDQGALEASFILDGSLDIMTREQTMLDAVVVATTIDDSNWKLLGEICEALDEGTERAALRDVVATVGPQATEHHLWAVETRQRMVLMQAKHPMAADATAAAEGVLDWFKGLFADT